MKISQNIIVGSGFSAFILNKILKKNYLVITTDSKYTKSLPERKNLTTHLKFFSKKFNSYGIYRYILKKSLLHDTLLHGGNTNLWGGICNISKIKKYFNFLRKIIFFKRISFNDTGSYSSNKYLFQMQKIGSNNGNIFNSSKNFKNLIKGHLVSFNIVQKNLICLKVKKKKTKNYFFKKIIINFNKTKLINILINSNIIKDKDQIFLREHKFKTKISLLPSISKNRNVSLILSYSLPGIVKHAVGTQKNFNKFMFRFLNFFPIFYHQIFYKKKIVARYIVEKKNLHIKEIFDKTDNKFGRSIHYFNMKINNINLGKKLKQTSKNIFGISSPFITNKAPGPISNDLIEKAFEVSKKLNK